MVVAEGVEAWPGDAADVDGDDGVYLSRATMTGTPITHEPTTASDMTRCGSKHRVFPIPGSRRTPCTCGYRGAFDTTDGASWSR